MTVTPRFTRSAITAVALACATLLAGCGAGLADAPHGRQQTAVAASTTFAVDLPTLPDEVAAQQLQPAFHLAPVLLDAPDASAGAVPHRVLLDAGHAAIPTRSLTAQAIADVRTGTRLAAGSGDATAFASGSVVATYTPAQIRAAYGLSTIPTGALTAAQAAALGAGQTIYIVDAMHDPNAAAELAAFNAKFNLPGCTVKTIAASAGLPLAAASGSACELSIVSSTPAGGMTATVPAYDAGWATEIALDVQWAHASAPLARIVVIETADSSIDSLLGGIRLANAMGPGVVSMSFGGSEGSWTASADSAFSGAGMTYLAATGDAGNAVSWPAVSSKVVAVGGTTLTWSGSGVRSETGWSSTGGGISAFTAAPSYQNGLVPGMGSPNFRNVADVSFNADPSTGQYTAVMAKGAASVSWVSAGGTSLSTPQWAGFVAVANARRALAAKAPLGAVHAVLYGQIAAAPGAYASAFGDIVKGSNGGCTACSAKAGYDILTGLGTPNVDKLLSQLADGSVAPVAPTIAAARVDGSAGTPLAFTISASGANPLSYALSGAPGGMVLGANGAVTWAAPAAGTYAVTVTATDTKTGAVSKAVYTIVIAAPVPPTVGAANVGGKAGTALSYAVTASGPNALTYALEGAPAGMGIGGNGVLSWPSPVAGTYAVTVVAKDTRTGLSGRGTVTVVITAQTAPAPVAPVVTPATVTGKPGAALSFAVSVSAANPVSYTLSGAPVGMGIATNGTVAWASPVAGTYTVTVVARDSRTGATGQGSITVRIVAGGPVLTVSGFAGVAGKALAGTIAISDPGATSLSVTISGAPMGMTFVPSGTSLVATWAAPTVGATSLKVTVTDNNNASVQAAVPVTVTAK